MNNQQNGNQQQQTFDSQSVSLHDNYQCAAVNGASKQKGNNKASQQNNNINEILINNNQQTLPINEQQEDELNLINNQNNSDMNSNSRGGDYIEPFGIIRGIAIGLDDELVVADESRVRVLEQSGDDGYVFKRELLACPQGRSGNSQAASLAASSNGRLCSMTYDAQHRLLLTLRTSVTTGTPFVQIVDYCTGKAKFTIDSFESKLMRPSSLATYASHVIVTDLGNDCIKKYRFY